MARVSDEVQVDHWLTLDDMPTRAPGAWAVDPAYLSYLAWQGPMSDEIQPEVDRKMAFLPMVLDRRDWDLLVRHQIEGQSQQEIADEMGVTQPAVSTAILRAKRIARALSVLYTLDPKVWDPALKGWEDLWQRTYEHQLGHVRRQTEESATRVANTLVLWHWTGAAELPITSGRWEYPSKGAILLPNSQSSVGSMVRRFIESEAFRASVGDDWFTAICAVKASVGYASAGAWRGPIEYRDVISRFLAGKSARVKGRA